MQHRHSFERCRAEVQRLIADAGNNFYIAVFIQMMNEMSRQIRMVVSI